MKKLLITLFYLSFTLAYAQTATPPAGSGTASDPYQIASLNNLYWLAADDAVVAVPDRTTRWSAHYIQTQDIDASATSSWNGQNGWTAIGNYNLAFTGVFNGDDKKVTDLYSNCVDINNGRAGFFGNIENAVLEHIQILDATISTSYIERSDRYCGILAGYASTSTITDCSVSGEVAPTDDISWNQFSGGFIGFTIGCNVNYCSCNSIVTDFSMMGGFIGYIGDLSVVTNCFANGSVNTTGTGTNAYSGGFCGITFNATVTNCYSKCSVTNTLEGSYAGGFAGGADGGSFNNCYATGLVSSTDEYSAKGFISNNFSIYGGIDIVYVNTSYFDTETTHQSSDGATANGGTVAIGKTTEEMKTQSTYDGWNFAFIWSINSVNNDGYPYLQPHHIATWLGATSSDWNTAGNWEGNVVPNEASDVIIPYAEQYPVINQDPATPAICNNMTIETETMVTINPGKALTVKGTINNGGDYNRLIINPGSSLIENNGAMAFITQSIEPGEWHLFSEPTSNVTSGVFYGHYLQEYSELTNAYTDITDPGVQFTPMKGYAVWGDMPDGQVVFAGPVNAGDISYIVTNENLGWNLIGNPYPSALDWEMAHAANSDIVDAAIYMHVNASIWASYASGVQTNYATQYIAPDQGFFVKAKTNGDITFTNAMRTHAVTTFYKHTTIIPNLIRLQVTGNGYSDEAVLRFLPEATAGYDREYDADKMFGDIAEAPQVYTLGSSPLSINSMPETNVVAVGVKAGTSGTFTLTATELNNMQFATLEDTKTDIFTDITQKSYTFSYTSGEDENRFKLHFSPLSVDETNSNTAEIYSNAKTVYVNFYENTRGDIFIYNPDGKLITSKSEVSGTNEFQLYAPGVYIVKTLTNKGIIVRKVMIL
jgi:hypothetical protein